MHQTYLKSHSTYGIKGIKTVFSHSKRGRSCVYALLCASFLYVFTGCKTRDLGNQSHADPRATSIPQTNAKWQSIGNCWIYAVMGWIEALALKGSEGRVKLNLSESYLTYRHYQELLLRESPLTSLDEGGSFERGIELIDRYGLMNEGDFIPQEQDQTKSLIQTKATAFVNESLRSGILASEMRKSPAQRSADVIKGVLNQAFQVDIDAIDARRKRVPIDKLIVGFTQTGQPLSLQRKLHTWVRRPWPQANAFVREPQAQVLTPDHIAILKAVKYALNLGQPVLLSFYVDFGALDKGVFSLKRLKEKGMGRQGGHLVVLTDYTAKGVNPANNQSFEVGEGQASAEQKKVAAQYGDLQSLIAKNSWGGWERDFGLGSYYYRFQPGFVKLQADYLLSYIPVAPLELQGAPAGLATSGITAFILPPGF